MPVASTIREVMKYKLNLHFEMIMTVGHVHGCGKRMATVENDLISSFDSHSWG